MRLIVPYRPRMLLRRTYEAAIASGLACEFVQLRNANEPVDPSRYQPTYGELVMDLWRAGAGFVMLEHDVVPYDGALEAVAICPEPWCGYGYQPNGGIANWYMNLGCTKVSAPGIAAVAPSIHPDHPWTIIDAKVSTAMTRAGYRPHRHTPDVEHRGLRHASGHRLGSETIDPDDVGDDYQPRYQLLQPRGRVGSCWMGDAPTKPTSTVPQLTPEYQSSLDLLNAFHDMMRQPIPGLPPVQHSRPVEVDPVAAKLDAWLGRSK